MFRLSVLVASICASGCNIAGRPSTTPTVIAMATSVETDELATKSHTELVAFEQPNDDADAIDDYAGDAEPERSTNEAESPDASGLVFETQSHSSIFTGQTPVEELVGYAVSNNPRIRAARAKAQSMLAVVPQVRSLEDPMLRTTVFLEEIQTAAGPQDLILSLSQKFPWFGKLDAKGNIACHDAKVAFAELADVELAISEQVKLAYYDLFFLHNALRTYRELEPLIENVIEVSKARYRTNSKKVGLESVLQAEIALNKLQVTVAELESANQKALARLHQALHLPQATALDIEPLQQTASVPGRAEDLVAMIAECHPQLTGRRHAVERDKWRVELANCNYYPDVTLGVNWNSIGSNGISPVSNGRDALSLMLGVNLPIYQTKRDAAVREAQWKTNHSSQMYAVTLDELRANVEQNYASAVENDRVLSILDDSIIEKSEQAFELSVEGYQVDRTSFEQLISNYESLLQFKVDFFLRMASREQAIARLERAVGSAVSQWPL